MKYLLPVLVLLCSMLDVFGMETKTVFYIERSKNSNIVNYEVNLLPDGKINPQNPFKAYWILRAKDGSKKALNFIEEKAYGFKTEFDNRTNICTLVINSFKKKPLKVYNENGTVKAEVMLNNKPAYLKKFM